MKWTIGMAACALTGLVLLAAAGRTSAEDKQAADKLQGTWTVAALVNDGKEQDNTGEQSVTFEGDKARAKTPNGEHEVTYKLDASQKPAAIDIIPRDGPHKDQTLKGIYSLKDDELKICWAHEPDADRPTKFESTAESHVMLITLKRAKP
jgi:uncharacterized protein (TIGR03067 family)